MKIDKAIASLKDIGTHQCIEWRERILIRNAGISHHLAKEYLRINKSQGYVAANKWLNTVSKTLKLGRTGLSLTGCNEELTDYCLAKAKKTLRQIFQTVHAAGKTSSVEIIRDVVNHTGVDFPLKTEYTQEQLLAAFARVCDEHWWKAQLRPLQSRELENFLRSLGGVNKHKEIYISDFSLKRRLLQKQRNKKLLDLLVAENQEGQSYTLSELAELSPSNPVIRRAELMTRLRGFENLANNSPDDYQGMFYTLTCPSKFHAAHVHGTLNAKYNGSSAKDSQDYLNTVWKRSRAAFKRQGLDPFGMRVVEPHHDGTPHWHLMLFIPTSQAEQLTTILRHYSFEMDGDERGAAEHRFTAVKIDPNKGSATGYIAKYIAKNIDGQHVDTDHYGKNAIESAIRIEAWASTHNIRQFQQIGGASITVWRELRRLDSTGIDKGLLKDLTTAADEGDWERYNYLMGGVNCLRKDRPIRPMMIQKAESNIYGEMVKVIKGIWFGPCAVITRVHEWTIKLKEIEQVNEADDGVGFGSALSTAPPAHVPLEFCQ
jgi:hypothetical protein